MRMNRSFTVQNAAIGYEVIIMKGKIYTQTEINAAVDKAWDDGYDVGYVDGRKIGHYDPEDEVD